MQPQLPHHNLLLLKLITLIFQLPQVKLSVVLVIKKHGGLRRKKWAWETIIKVRTKIL